MNLLFPYRLLQIIGWPFFLFSLAGKRRPLWSKKLSPPRLPEKRPLIWVHTLSVGEIQAAAPLLKALREEFPSYALFFSVATVSGFDLARTKLKDLYDFLWTSPLDLFPFVKRFIKALSPQAFVLVETDLWPETLWSLKASGIPLFFVNAALSTKAQKRLSRFRALARLLYEPFDLLGAATPKDQKRLSSVLPEKEIFYFGNLKFDLPPPSLEEAEGLIQELAPKLKPPVIVCGSTHPGEEELWLKAFSLLGKGSLVLCPRKPERADGLLRLARKMGFRASLRTKPQEAEVLIVDTLGELKDLYALADLAFVGGSLVPVGGHNLLEPARWGKPVLFGPYVESIADLAEELEAKRGGRRLRPDPEDIAHALQELLPRARDFGMQALMVAKHHRGAARRYTRFIAEALSSASLLR